MAPKGSTSRGVDYPYYVCTDQVHYRGTTTCRAPQIPAKALDEETIDRLRSLDLNIEDRQRIRDEALRQLDDSSQKLEAEISAVRKRLTGVATEINNLVAVLTQQGASLFESLSAKLSELEEERRSLRQKLDELTVAAEPANRVTDSAKRFVDGWHDVGDLLSMAEPSEQREIIHCFVASLELKFHERERKRADYILRLYPELRELNDDPSVGRQTGQRGDDPLTTDAKLRRVAEKAPCV